MTSLFMGHLLLNKLVKAQDHVKKACCVLRQAAGGRRND